MGLKSWSRSTLLTASFLFTACLALRAQQTFKVAGDSSWELTGRDLTIHATQISNFGANDSGPLFLSIYAQSGVPYNGGGASPGRLLGRIPIGTIAAGAQISGVTVTARHRVVPQGYKFTTLVLEEKNGRRFTILDYIPYYSSYAFPRGQNGGVGSEDSGIGRGDVTMLGANSLTVRGRRADFAIEKIQSQREPNATELLRLAIYASDAPYDGGPNRTVLGVRSLGTLAPGDYYGNVQGRMPLRHIRRGIYYLTLAVEEMRGGEFVPVAYVPYPDAQQL